MSDPNHTPPSPRDILYLLNHIFLPPKLPQEDDADPNRDIVLCRLVYNASLDFARFLPEGQRQQWSIVTQMLSMLLETTRVFDKGLMKKILHLKDKDVLVLHIHAQNAALILRRLTDTMVFEAFEVSPPPEAVMGVQGKLICSYPGPAVQLPLTIAQDSSFVEQLVSFLTHMDVDRLDADATTTKAGSKVAESRGTTHPRYITQLLMMILCGMGSEATVTRITKRIADEACWKDARNPWRRSPLWLVLRVAIQTTAASRGTYKSFLVFFQVQLLQLFLYHNFSSELLYVTRVKTSRRAYKLGEHGSPKLLQAVEAIGSAIGECLQERWSEEQLRQVISPAYTANPSTIELERDTTISLLNSRGYLNTVVRPDRHLDSVMKFAPDHFPRLRNALDFRLFHADGLTKAVEADPYTALADFEFFVQERLDRWVEENRQDELACEVLGSCLKQYISAAQHHYTSNPESQSIMLLTIMELWVALDTIAVTQCPLLSCYSPEIPASFLDPLLLRRAKSIERAGRIERYLRARHSNTTVSTSIYSNQLDHSSFSVRYFRESPHLQDMKASMEQDAANAREAKCAELQAMNAEYALLSAEAAGLSCTYNDQSIHKRRSCHRCKVQKKANKLQIKVHEWPLPNHPMEAKSVVFELNRPRVFAIWRTRTYQILRDIGMAHVSVQSEITPHILLENYEGFATVNRKTIPTGRITFGSETKSFLNSHYCKHRLPAQEGNVCVNNGLRFSLYDTIKGEGMPSSFELSLDPYCTLRLPVDGDGLYQHLQYAVSHTTHAHNGTIANQRDCPVNLSLHEHLAFSNLRCGSQLQWMNIARELRTNTLTFSREEVHTLITQAAWQIGPLSKDGSMREWHFELGLPDFGLVLIREATGLLSRVEANWMEGTTVKTIIYLTTHLLTSAADSQQQVRQGGYALLRNARGVTHRWMREILERLRCAVGDIEATELQRQACEIAATCRATFDVDPGIHLDALLSSSADIAVLIECTIVFHDNTPHLSDTSPDFQKLLHRDRRLSHLLESTVFNHICADRSGLDNAISSIWSGYHPGEGGWKQLKEPNTRWMMSYTAPSPDQDQRAQQVHYNLLQGKLIVDGKPLGRLPQEIVGHPTYRRTFGQKILDVIPADMPGMQYASRFRIYGYQVYFALRDNSQNLIIRARTPSDQLLELVPHTILEKDFPTFFSTEHAHWMDVESGEVEFRPLDRLWEQSSQNWRLTSPSGGLPSKLIHGASKNCSLIDIQSQTFQGIASRIRPLESPEYMTAVYDFQSHTISIELPRFRLSFFANKDGELESKNTQGMIIDKNQCTGTMIGLNSQLVLCHKDPISAGLPRSRHVLIPHGDIHFSLPPNHHHVQLNIDTSTTFTRQVTWYKYEIDTDLGLLVGNVSLTSRLYRIYLHALCSHVLPDPLTSQTGTNHALQELGAAGCFSFQTLTEADSNLLQLIGRLTPLRHYYPEQLHTMQTTEWSPQLPELSQHGAFDTTVRSIMKHAQSLTIFSQPKDKDLEYESEGNLFLMERAMWRNAIYYEGGLYMSANFDRRYNSRHSPHITKHDSDGIEALNTAQLVYAWPVGLACRLGSSELLDTFKEWGNMSGPAQKAFPMVYSAEWLDLDLPTKWLSIYNQMGEPTKKFELVFSFAALAYSKPNFRKLIPILLTFATTHMSSFIPPPQHLSYDLTDGFGPLRKRLKRTINSEIKDVDNSPIGQLERNPNETSAKFLSRRLTKHKVDSQLRANNAAKLLMAAWHSSTPSSPFQSDDSEWFNIEKVMTDVTEYFSSCSRNRDLRSFISQVTERLQSNYVHFPLTGLQTPIFCFVPQFDVSYGPRQSLPSNLENLLLSRTGSAPDHPTRKFGAGAPIGTDTNVKKLISQFRRTRNINPVLTKLYSERLERSLTELHGQKISMLCDTLPPMSDCLAYRDLCRIHLNDIFTSIHSAVAPSTTMEWVLADAGLWPRIHPRSLLHLLASTANICLTDTPEWTGILTAFAEIFIEYQYSQRLVAYALHSETDNFFKELNNASFNRSDAMEYPDWLLIQIQGNFIARAVQSDVAREMIKPSSGNNTVLQLNMGEGKSHVIVPLVAAALADSKRLVRVVVLKPLAGQMFHLLVERISGLANRRVFYLPFSRDVKMTVPQVRHIRNLFEECARVRGVLVAQPEHILSFQIMVIDRILQSGSPLDDVAQELNETQKWLTSTSRDVLDESDELLHVRYQLIYTMGQQQRLDYGPTRWIITQNIFNLVRQHLEQLHHSNLSKEVELLEHRGEEACDGGFSHVRLLGTLAADELISRISEAALDGKLDSLPFVGLRNQPSLHAAALCFITKRDLDRSTYLTVESAYGKSGLWKGLLLLRGLLAHGILIYVLSQQRWRVDYGLDLKRSRYAVPYRAKDMPSLRSEFGHPDVALCLTCLSYYYGGLTCDQVRECFDLLIRLDNPALEYEKWVQRGGRDIPEPLRQLIGVNMKDVQTFTHDIIPKFWHNQAVIDFFLSHIVFPKEAKEFPQKLGTSAWDLAEEKVNPTTGFSGTNDNSDLLPTSITQRDPINQLRTNAQVLEYLLRPENESYICKDINGQPCSVKEFLALLVREPKEIRVLLDVGAQMLEMTNQQLVEHWLSLRKGEVAAGVFFDDADRLSVLSQDGVVELLYSSPFFQRLDQCIIYLDDAHTRGTDLKLPSSFRAAVTLGPKVTKDRLVQGCMRMRKLGHGQSVIFCAPYEVDRQIRNTELIHFSDPVRVSDVLSWVMSRTCFDIDHHLPHWVQQGVDYKRRRYGDIAFSCSADVEHLENTWLQPAAQSLEQMYGVTTNSFNNTVNAVNYIPDMRERLHMLGVNTLRDAGIEEEQEREVSHEVDQQLQAQRPPIATPTIHHLDEAVSYFVRNGIIPANSAVFLPLMTPFRFGSEQLNPLNPWSTRLLGTQDFMTTTNEGREKTHITDYLRPVNWIVSLIPSDGEMMLVVMSPYEVNILLQDIRASKYVRLHMYAPCAMKAMKPFDDLQFYCIPPLPLGNTASITPSLDVRCQLNIWAGQLYLDRYETYLRLCLLLGISWSEKVGYSSVEIDRFVPERGRKGEMQGVCLFNESPLALLKTLFGLRRKGMSYDLTHMGRILSARVLSEEDFGVQNEKIPAAI